MFGIVLVVFALGGCSTASPAPNPTVANQPTAAASAPTTDAAQATDVVPVPSGDICQLLSASDQATLQLTGTDHTVTTQHVAPTNQETTLPAGATAIGCIWSVAEPSDALAGTITVMFESQMTYQHDQQFPGPAPTATPTDLPPGALVVLDGGSVEMSSNGVYFQVIVNGNPYNSEPGTVASLLIPHLTAAG
jgi:hypothetical protein